jgi:hypothetical protein
VGRDLLLLVVSVSLCLQVATIMAAMRLVRTTGWKASWMLVALGILTMGVRRFITLIGLLAGNRFAETALLYETVGLVGSLVMLLGVRAVHPAFVALKNASREQRELIASLQHSQGQVKMLRGILPICSYCHRIRNDRETWEKLEQYVSEHTEAQFSHGLCPDCLKLHYPDLSGKTE